MIFPIGHFEKNEVREIAEREHLVNAKRRDSQGICFLGNIDYNEYVKRYLGEKIGDVVGQRGKTINEIIAIEEINNFIVLVVLVIVCLMVSLFITKKSFLPCLAVSSSLILFSAV